MASSSNTGTTDHFTYDLPNLQQPTKYRGGVLVLVGNGKTLPVTHIGNSQLQASKHLRHILKVPGMKSNLLSVHKYVAKIIIATFILMSPCSLDRTFIWGKCSIRAIVKTVCTQFTSIHSSSINNFILHTPKAAIFHPNSVLQMFEYQFLLLSS